MEDGGLTLQIFEAENMSQGPAGLLECNSGGMICTYALFFVGGKKTIETMKDQYQPRSITKGITTAQFEWLFQPTKTFSIPKVHQEDADSKDAPYYNPKSSNPTLQYRLSPPSKGLSLSLIQQMQKEVSTYQQLVEFIFKNGGVVVAQFFNNWSAPCKLITPHLDALRSQFAIAVARIDTDRSQELSSKFDIHALPSFLLLRKASGEVTAVEIVVSAHVEKLKRLFENASNIKNNKN